MQDLEIRESLPGDRASIETLYPAAFPDEDLLPLVGELLAAGPAVLSLAASDGPQLVGHAVFTTCSVDNGPDAVALLGPLAVAPARQRQGIGSALVRAGLERLEADGIKQVYVLGDPNYYGRLGFRPDTAVAPPYPLPQEWREAWQSLSLGNAEPLHGTLSVPQPWRQPALWAP